MERKKIQKSPQIIEIRARNCTGIGCDGLDNKKPGRKFVDKDDKTKSEEKNGWLLC